MRWILGAVFVLLSAMSTADGMFIPAGTIAGQPTIPDQRAILIWDGKKHEETLIIESSLRGAKGDYSWVVPLPSVPKSIERARPSVMQITFDRSRPQLRRARPGLETLSLVTCVVLLLCALWAALASQPVRRDRLSMLGKTLVPGVLLCLIVGALGDSGGERSKGSSAGIPEAASLPSVQVAFRGTVGSYDVAVVKGTIAADLVQWLDIAGTPLPKAAKPVVDKYISEGWCFMAAKLRKEGTADHKPHPIRAVFAAKEAVYPMRLTQLGSTKLELDLLVIAEQREARAEHMKFWGSRSLDGEPESELRHVDVHPFIPPNALSTRLRGTLTPDLMGEDLKIRWGTYSVVQPELVTRPALLSDARIYGFAAATVIGLFVALIGALKVWPALVTVAAVLLSAAGAGVAMGSAVARQNPDLELDSQTQWRQHDAARNVHWIELEGLKHALQAGYEPFPERFLRQLAVSFRQQSGDWQSDRSRVVPLPADLAKAKAWNHDELGGWQMKQTSPGHYSVQLMDEQGVVAVTEVVDRRIPLDKVPVRVDLNVEFWPPKLVKAAKHSMPLDYSSMMFRGVFVKRNGREKRLKWEDHNTFSSVLVPGTYTVIFREEPWQPKDLGEIKVPVGKPARFSLRLNVTDRFAPQQ